MRIGVPARRLRLNKDGLLPSAAGPIFATCLLCSPLCLTEITQQAQSQEEITTAEHVKIVNDVSLSQRPTLPAARDKARASSASRDLFLVLCAYCILYTVVSNQYRFLGLVTK